MAPRKREPHPETCPRCPNRYSEVGCPFWLTGKEGLQEERPVLAGPPDVRIITGCVWDEGHMLRWISHVVAASNRGAASIESFREDVTEALNKFADKVTAAAVIESIFGKEGSQPLVAPNQPKRIEDSRSGKA